MTRDDIPGADESWDERSLLLTMLRYTQQTAVAKVSGLSQELARATPLPTSPRMALSNVLNHLRWVEWSWVHVDSSASPTTARGRRRTRTPSSTRALSCRSRTSSGSTRSRPRRPARSSVAPTSMPSRLARRKRPLTVRWMLLHLIEETARHNGHLDILREMADGSVGD